MKKIIALLMVVVLILISSLSVIASDNNSNYKFEFDGVVYNVEESKNSNGNKMVTVNSDNGEINTVVNDGNFLYVNTIGRARSINSYVIKIDNNYQGNINSKARSVYKQSLYWNYYYYYSTGSSYGVYWDLNSGDDYGNWYGFDANNSNARNLAYDFCSSVRSLDTAQWVASAASGASGGSIAAAIASAGPTLGVGTVVGIVAAIVSGGVAVAEWVSAYNCSLDCNEYFTRFKQEF